MTPDSDKLVALATAGQVEAKGSLQATAWIFSVFLAVTALGLLSRCADTTTEVAPDRTELILAISTWAGLAGGLAMLIAILWFTPSFRSSHWASTLVLTFVAALNCAFALGSVAEVTFQRTDFLHSPVLQSSALLPIRRAYIGSGRGWRYEVQLIGPFLTLDVGKREYVAAFGTAQDFRGSGWCLLAVVERSGQAMRIVHGRRWPFPAGRPVRCGSRTAPNVQGNLAGVASPHP